MFSFSLEPVENDLVDRTFPRTPFVPANKALRDERCEEILTLQATGLATRLRHTHAKTAVVGLSGGWIPRWLSSCSYMRLICSNSTAGAFWPSRCRASARPPAPRAMRKNWRNLRRYAQDRGYQGGRSISISMDIRSVQGRSFRLP